MKSRDFKSFLDWEIGVICSYFRDTPITQQSRNKFVLSNLLPHQRTLANYISRLRVVEYMDRNPALIEIL